MSFKPQQFVDGGWCSNGQAFETIEEAQFSALNRFYNWTMSGGYRAIESDEKVNFVWDNDKGDIMLEEAKNE